MFGWVVEEDLSKVVTFKQNLKLVKQELAMAGA